MELDSVVSDEKEKECIRNSIMTSSKNSPPLNNEYLDETEDVNITEQIEELQKDIC
jgi:hypothetical protein